MKHQDSTNHLSCTSKGSLLYPCRARQSARGLLAPPSAHLQAARVVPLPILVLTLQACPARLDQCTVERGLAQPPIHSVVGLQGAWVLSWVAGSPG